ncbi:MAG: uracil-DNA glycosylase family protein [Rhodobacterales bacterium]|nr:uracil-DNA glycosylase family protein [Rhodobacterales bacterium]
MPKAQAECENLLGQVRACRICPDLPLEPRPILQINPKARILIAGQAPGRIAHEKGVPFDDPSGNRLRDWMGIGRARFYDATQVAIVPMGFCFPGAGKGGDLPPRRECELAWRQKLLAQLPDIGLTIVIGKYALDWHLPASAKTSVTEVVKNWRAHWPLVLPIPHPSPRNNRWLKSNPWFEIDVVPKLQERVRQIVE